VLKGQVRESLRWELRCFASHGMWHLFRRGKADGCPPVHEALLLVWRVTAVTRGAVKRVEERSDGGRGAVEPLRERVGAHRGSVRGVQREGGVARHPAAQ